jgi:hypothetical protein
MEEVDGSARGGQEAGFIGRMRVRVLVRESSRDNGWSRRQFPRFGVIEWKHGTDASFPRRGWFLRNPAVAKESLDHSSAGATSVVAAAALCYQDSSG